MKSAIVILLVIFWSGIDCELSSDNDVYTLEHSIDQQDFKPIGHINLRVLKQSLNSAQLLTINEHTHSSQASSSSSHSTKIESDDFDAETRDQIVAYASDQSTSSDNHSIPVIYRLRICRGECYASTFTYLSRLIETGFQCNLAIHINPNTNRPNSISLKSSSVKSKTTNTKKSNQRLIMHVTLQSAKLAQQPDTEAYIEKVKREIEQKERAEQGDNQTFWSKYWIYIVPFVVVMFLANLANPEGGAAPAS